MSVCCKSHDTRFAMHVTCCRLTTRTLRCVVRILVVGVHGVPAVAKVMLAQAPSQPAAAAAAARAPVAADGLRMKTGPACPIPTASLACRVSSLLLRQVGKWALAPKCRPLTVSARVRARERAAHTTTAPCGASGALLLCGPRCASALVHPYVLSACAAGVDSEGRQRPGRVDDHLPINDEQSPCPRCPVWLRVGHQARIRQEAVG